MLYVEATADQGLESWAMADVRAFEAYGCVTVAVTPDYVTRNIIGLGGIHFTGPESRYS